MKTANLIASLIVTLAFGAADAQAQTPVPTAAVTVPPATAPAPVTESAPATASAALPAPPEPSAPQVATTAGVQVPSTAAVPVTAETPIGTPAAPTIVAPVGGTPVAAAGAVPVSGTPAAMPASATPPNAPTGTPAVVGQVLQNLQQARSNVSVDDLSRAQDALTRLDLLLQIEKKMGEIKQVQDERSGAAAGGAPGAFGPVSGGMGNVISQVPATALVLPTGGMGGAPGGGMPMASIKPAAPVETGYTVEQVSGANGDYTATLRDDAGEVKLVKVGDRLDGRTVDTISLDGVHLAGPAGKHGKRGGKTLELKTNSVMTAPSTLLMR